MKKALIAFCIVGAACAMAGCKNREEQLEAERSKGAEMVEDKAALVKGVGQALQNDGKKAAAEITTGVGKVFGGVAEGVDRAHEAKIALDASASGRQLKSERAVLLGADGEKKDGVKVYVLSAQAFKGKLQLRAVDGKGSEVGRSDKIDSDLGADDASYVEFRFDSATPMSRVDKFVLYVL
ncbi:hypothetical protein Q9Q94_05275 [Uliginosibacterium sp. 31-16]|uniref:hypothetical protein n=1 Tax=Uliginosibacterium sp. 31-16 TaxID=3068315 RepID=UPI00273EBB49|nr:hypothetical protein [Uliginosibacterium sp. 31-16]MDP5238929.1 hypothetical protein [Uliginosibacterium sp. 31-16]